MIKTAAIIAALTFIGNSTASAQQRVSDGTASATINPNAVLEMQSNNKGMLLPRVALTATTNAAPLSAHVAGMYVYNTATAGDVKPGNYYNDGTKWYRVSMSLSGTTTPTGTAPTNTLYTNTSTGDTYVFDGSTWQLVGGANTVVVGTVPAAVIDTPTSNQGIFNTGCSITLTPGKWKVEFAGWIQAYGTEVLPLAEQSGFASLFLSTSATSHIAPTYIGSIKSIIIPDLYGPGPTTAHGTAFVKYGSGSLYVSVPTTTTLYLWSYYSVNLTATASLPDAAAFYIKSVNNTAGNYGPYTHITALKLQ